MTNYPQLESLWLQSSLTFKCWMGVGGKCTTRRKRDRDWVGAPDPVSYAWRRCAGRDEEWGNRRMLQP